MNKEIKRYTCPCCGYMVFSEPPGSYEICPICFWEDDNIQLSDFNMAGGANKVSLLEGQKNYEKFGAVEERLIRYVRKPTNMDIKDKTWRKINEKKDIIDTLEPSGDYKLTQPEDFIKPYYWKKR